MSVGFIVTGRDREMECGLLDQSALTTFVQEKDAAVTLLGRLYYRDDLRARLPNPPAADASDAALALAAYRAEGEDGLARLEGDFALVVRDWKTGRMIGARDPMGGYPLYWAELDGTVVFSTSLRAVAELLPRRELNPDYLAAFLTLPSIACQEAPSEDCVYRGVRRVRPGGLAVARLDSGRVEQRIAWDWLNHVDDPGTDRLEELADRFRERLEAAVRQRLGRVTAAHLSGGMDSTGVALLARNVRAASGGGPVRTLSVVYHELSFLAKETPYVECALAGQEGLEPYRINGDDFLAFNGMADAPQPEEPWTAVFAAKAQRALADAAVAAGTDVVLTGLGSDDLVDAGPYHLADLLRSGRPFAAWSEAKRLAAGANSTPWSYLANHGLDPLLPAWLGLGGAADQWAAAPWIRPAFARRHDVRGRLLAHRRRLFGSCRPLGVSVLRSAFEGYAGDAARWLFAAPRGLAVAHPFFDPRVLSLGLGLQLRLRPTPGVHKPLLAAALRDVLPEKIRTRRGKGHSNEVYFLGLSRNLPALEALVRRAPVDDLEMFDKEALLRPLRQAALGVSGDARSLARLDLTLSLLQWLTNERVSAGERGRVSAPSARRLCKRTDSGR